MKKIILPIALAMCWMWTSCSSDTKKNNDQQAVSVKAYSPMSQDSASVTVSGKLAAKNSAQISTRIMAYVDEIYVKHGDRVKAGQLLIKLNSDDLLARKKQVAAQMAEATQAVENANKDFRRFEALHQSQSISDKELENMRLNKVSMESKLQMARHAMKEVEAMMAYTLIKAPFAGTVTQKYIDKGSTASPGMPLLVVEQDHEMEVRANVPENFVSDVKVGDRVTVEVKTLQRIIRGTVSELSTSASNHGGQYAMKVELDEKKDAQLLGGMYVAVNIPTKVVNGDGARLLIEKSSIVEREQLKGVYVVNADSRAILHWLRLGKTYGNQVEVLSGLNRNELVIDQAQGKLYNGRKVTVTQ